MTSTLSYAVALKKVQECVRGSKTSFGAGMAILPKDRRNAMYALYAFCRIVDDIADDGASEPLRRAGLEEWRKRIRRLFHDRFADEFVGVALLPAIDLFGLVEEDFQTIINGMEMDAGDDPIYAPQLKQLDLYCDKVASAVGRVSVRIFGDSSSNGMNVAFHLGRALQLTNILRDIAEDAQRGRLYLPREILERHGVGFLDPLGKKDPFIVLNHPKLADVCRDLASHAREHYAVADKMMDLCKAGTMKPARIMRVYYGAIFNKLVTLDWREPQKRVSLSKPFKIWLVVCALLGAKKP